MRWMRVIPVLVVLLAVSCGARAQSALEPLRMTIRTPVGDGVVMVSPPSPLITDVVTLTVRLTLEPGWELLPVTLDGAVLPEGWTVVGTEAMPPEAGPGGTRVVSRRVRLDPFLPGEVKIGPVRVVVSRGEEQHEVEAGPIGLTVRSVLPAEEPDPEPAGIRSVVGLPFRVPGWAWGVAAGVVAMAGAIAALVYMMAKQARRIRLVRMTAHETALRRLDALVGENLLATGRFKEFYLGLSSILRRYLEDRFGLAAPERTTEEFLREARSSNVLTERDVVLLEEFLSHCDLVKFAAAQPDPGQADRTVGVVRDFIDRTRSVEAQLVVDPLTGEARRPERLSDPVIAAAARAGRTSVAGPSRGGGGA